jgi:hypothetical protein
LSNHLNGQSGLTRFYRENRPIAPQAFDICINALQLSGGIGPAVGLTAVPSILPSPPRGSKLLMPVPSTLLMPATSLIRISRKQAPRKLFPSTISGCMSSALVTHSIYRRGVRSRWFEVIAAQTERTKGAVLHKKKTVADPAAQYAIRRRM